MERIGRCGTCDDLSPAFRPLPSACHHPEVSYTGRKTLNTANPEDVTKYIC